MRNEYHHRAAGQLHGPLRLVIDGDIDRGGHETSESEILTEVVRMLDWALTQSSLSMGWRAAFQTSRRHLAGDVGLRDESTERTRPARHL